MKSPPSLPLHTSRLVLRAYATGDVEPTLAYYGDAEVSRFLLTGPFALKDAKEAVERRRGQTDPTEPGDALALVVEHQGRLVGDLTLKLLGEQRSMGEIGWCFNPAYGGRGFATRPQRRFSTWRSSITTCTESRRRWTRATPARHVDRTHVMAWAGGIGIAAGEPAGRGCWGLSFASAEAAGTGSADLQRCTERDL